MTDFLSLHPIASSALTVWVLSGIATALIGLMPAPTKDSSKRYVVCFKLANGFVGNARRARSTSIESSPNWPDAVDKVIASMNGSAATHANLPETKS